MSGDTIKGTPLLKEAIVDAERLLSYASEYGIEIEQKHIKAIINAKKNNQNDSWIEQDEINFWSSLQVLAKTIHPVSIDSLRAASPPQNPKINWWTKIWGNYKRPMVERTVSSYRKFALVAMIFMLIIQIYSLIGTALLAKVNFGNERMKEIELHLQSLTIRTSFNPDDRTAQMKSENLDSEQGELEQEVQSSIYLLNDWLDASYNIWFKENKKISDEKGEGNVSDGPPEDGTSELSNNIVVIQRSKNLIIIFNQYLLPLLYGLLGGIAFVLRSLADETRNMTYTPTSRIKYGLRIHLGALAGLVIGFLWGDFQSKSFGVIESLSPLAVAFIAGYSVDFLFRMLDSVIGTTSKKAAVVALKGSSKEKEK